MLWCTWTYLCGAPWLTCVAGLRSSLAARLLNGQKNVRLWICIASLTCSCSAVRVKSLRGFKSEAAAAFCEVKMNDINIASSCCFTLIPLQHFGPSEAVFVDSPRHFQPTLIHLWIHSYLNMKQQRKASEGKNSCRQQERFVLQRLNYKTSITS